MQVSVYVSSCFLSFTSANSLFKTNRFSADPISFLVLLHVNFRSKPVVVRLYPRNEFVLAKLRYNLAIFFSKLLADCFVFHQLCQLLGKMSRISSVEQEPLHQFAVWRYI